MCNQDIRQETMAAGLRLWQVAEALGMADHSFSRKLRHELPEKEKPRIMAVINELAQEAEQSADT